MIPQCKQNKIGGVSGDTFPIGAVIEWDFEELPNNWLWTDHDYLIEDYPELYALCGTRFNKEDTPEGYFRTPPRAGLVAVGKDENDSDFNELGKVLGSKDIQEHAHSGKTNTGEAPFMRIIGAAGTGYAANHIPGYSSGEYTDVGNSTDYPGANHIHHFTTDKTGTGNSGNIQPSVVTNYIIKAHQSAGVVAEVIQEDSEETEKDVYSAKAIKKIIEDMIMEDNKKKYYVGKIIMDTANVNPATYLGFGTWQYWGSGRVPVGVDENDPDFDTVEKTSGNKYITLSAAIGACNNDSGTLGYKAEGLTDYQVGNPPSYIVTGNGLSSVGHWNHSTPVTDKNSTKRETCTVQPSITCYMWKRVA